MNARSCRIEFSPLLRDQLEGDGQLGDVAGVGGAIPGVALVERDSAASGVSSLEPTLDVAAARSSGPDVDGTPLYGGAAPAYEHVPTPQHQSELRRVAPS